MGIGTLNQRITILEHRTVIDEIGNHITKWEETFSLWAKVTVKTASETTDAGAINIIFSNFYIYLTCYSIFTISHSII